MLTNLLALTITYASVLISDAPHVEQRPDFCGEACAEMGLRRLGIPITQDQIFTLSGVDPMKGRGLVTDELAATLRKLGFDVGTVWNHIDPSKAPEQLEAQWAALHADLERGIPSIICGWSSFGEGRTQHMRLVVGYDRARDEVLYEEPAQSSAELGRMKRSDFMRLWTFKPSSKRWNLIRMTLRRVGPLPELPRDTSAADLSQHVQALKEKAPAGTTVLRTGAFVVAGDEAPEKVKSRVADQVEWATRLLKKDFFDADPDALTDVWIFKDRRSYETNAKALFGEAPTTPYGYYLPAHRAMVMNIKPGYGTLVHELVHPYVAKNCPTCPAWLNEGLASLFERPVEREGHLRGLPNWRLPGLQDALRADSVKTFKQLTALTDAQFYDDDTGVHYAQARYLCYWLQEHGLLVKLVRGMQTRPADDPTGFGVLSSLVDMRRFDAVFAKDTLALQDR
jgi:hypothetical protein